MEPIAQLSTELELQQVQIQEMSKLIKNEAQLKSVLLRVPNPNMRQMVYEQIVPHLKFTPRVYRKLMKHVH